jgi:adenosylcobinamide kinase/adenosylcobinamide-phosphate guanylyltransferase
MSRSAAPRATLVLGGARSGKSRHAEILTRAQAGSRGTCVYLATAEPFDAEMRARIAAHQSSRGPDWRTREAPLDLPVAIAAEARRGQAVLVDCLTVWLGNLMHHGRDIAAESEALMVALVAARGPVVLVANEVGLGIVPDNALARSFRDAAGRLNQTLAAAAGRVVFVAAGLPLQLKGEPVRLTGGGQQTRRPP